MIKEEAIKGITKIWKGYTAAYSEIAEEDVKAFEMAIEALERSQWTPCGERLPKEYAQYLVCFEDGSRYVYLLDDSDWARGLIEKENIVAWMPLPEPYREEE